MTMRLDEASHGLTTERQRLMGRMIHEFDPILTLRRVPERDPAFNRQKPFGIYEEGVKSDALSNWVFFVSEDQLDVRILAQLFENSLVRQGADARIAKQVAMANAQKAMLLATRRAEIEEREDQMLFIGRQARQNRNIRLNVDGDDIIIGDDVRRAKTFIS